MFDWLFQVIDNAASTLLGWACVIGGTLVVGFCAGYWIGHREITGFMQTLVAFVRIPVLWLGNPEMFVAYGVCAIAWYLPPHYESRWLRVGSAAANLLVWFIVIYSVVVKMANSKFFRY